MPIIIDDLLALFDVDLGNGKIFWKNPSKYHNDLKGMEAGIEQSGRAGKNYWVIQINGLKYRRGRLIFLLLNGRFPAPCIDHINGNSLDDRPSNLREATILQNSWNHKAQVKPSGLPEGVRINKSSGRYGARISYCGKQLHLGGYKTPEEAHNVYMAKRKELYADFS